MRNLWRAFIRKLPKRVILENRIYYPQVWFIWWHSVWDGGGEYCSEICYSKLEDAKEFIKHNWDPIEKPKREVVWREGSKDE
jgi:hypothetical protein